MRKSLVTIALAAMLAGCSTGPLSWIMPGVTVEDVKKSAPRSIDDGIQFARLQIADAYVASAALLRSDAIDIQQARGIRSDLRAAEALLAASEMALGGGQETAARLDLENATELLSLVQRVIAEMEDGQ